MSGNKYDENDTDTSMGTGEHNNQNVNHLMNIQVADTSAETNRNIVLINNSKPKIDQVISLSINKINVTTHHLYNC